jgi:cyclic pyranopterin phosphate synthase
MTEIKSIATAEPSERLVDRFGRVVRYLRLSVTDRCDFRCVYCMDEEMTFVPRSEVLTLEEMQIIAEAFVELGVEKIRLTGGEPLIRSGVVDLCQSIASIESLGELVMTTNGSRLTELAVDLRNAGIKKLNISLDTLDPDKFRELTRVGSLDKVLSGINAAIEAGFESIKLNAVILKGRNDHEVVPLVRFAVQHGIDISFIEEMPLGSISEHNRSEAFISSETLRENLKDYFEIEAERESDLSSGPSRYYKIAGSSSRVGFISPHSENFCSDCNRVRVTAEGKLLLCLGNEHSADLKRVLRENDGCKQALKSEIVAAMVLKPEKHHFDLDAAPQIVRFMNATGG